MKLEKPFAVHVYRALARLDAHAHPWVVTPKDVSRFDPDGGRSLLTLTSCHPKGSAQQRLVMRFALVSSEPRLSAA